jgi:AcrR family transcriptional regulator
MLTATDEQEEDRRSRRSRELLKRSFLELMREKGFTAITVKVITDRADVHRGTFYAHFPDKFALLEQAIRDKFRFLLNERLPADAGFDPEHLRLLVRTVLEHVRSLYGRCNPVDTVDPLFERSIRGELTGLLTEWLERFGPDRPGGAPAGTMALMMSWAIFGAAVEWSRGRGAVGVDEMTDLVLAVLTEGARGLMADGD